MTIEGDRLREFRLRNGLTQSRLAARSGVAQANIAAYERGSRRPSTDMVDRLMSAARIRPSEALALHRDEALRLARAHRATDLRVFGSVARGEDTVESDLDLIARFEKGASLFDLAELVVDLEELLGCRVDLVSEDGLPEEIVIRSTAVPV